MKFGKKVKKTVDEDYDEDDFEEEEDEEEPIRPQKRKSSIPDLPNEEEEIEESQESNEEIETPQKGKNVIHKAGDVETIIQPVIKGYRVWKSNKEYTEVPIEHFHLVDLYKTIYSAMQSN